MFPKIVRSNGAQLRFPLIIWPLDMFVYFGGCTDEEQTIYRGTDCRISHEAEGDLLVRTSVASTSGKTKSHVQSPPLLQKNAQPRRSITRDRGNLGNLIAKKIKYKWHPHDQIALSWAPLTSSVSCLAVSSHVIGR